jgi:xylulose-5-phosphate/fructose-6-phosphate phosphoketolase
MAGINGPGRFSLASGAIGQAACSSAYAKHALRGQLITHKAYIRQRGEDMPEVWEWRWPTQ